MRRGWLRCCFPCSDEEGEESGGHPAAMATTTARSMPRALSRSRSFESHSSKSFSSRRTPDPGKSSRKALKMSLNDRERILQLVQKSHHDSQWSSPLDEDALSNISFEDVQVPMGTKAPYVPVCKDQDAFQVPVWSLRAMVTRSRARNMQMRRSGHHLMSMSGREKIRSQNASKSRREQQWILAQAIVAKYAKDEDESNTEWRNSCCKSMPVRQSQLGDNSTQSQGGVELGFRRSVSERISMKGGSRADEAAPLQQMSIEHKCTKMEEIQMPEIV
ncbi:hypothetical protein BSKO_00821 [Bryopsis sp. KO-2023]|nr:hypothetical protein BSKO_00821 [Bryopsis sp. KO-2023]